MEKARIRLQSGLNVDLSDSVHDECYRYFDDFKYAAFSHAIDSGQYFPQIVQFAMVMGSILKGHTSFRDIFLCNMIYGAGYTLLWYWLKLYKLPGLSFFSSLIGGSIFRLNLHFVAIAIVALLVVKDWRVILYCVACGFITQIVKSFLQANLSTVRYNDEVAVYVSKFRS